MAGLVDLRRDPDPRIGFLAFGETRGIGISRCHPGAVCESCDQPARFRFQYNFSIGDGELVLCDHHLRDVMYSDQWIMAMLTEKLHEMLDLNGSPLLLP